LKVTHKVAVSFGSRLAAGCCWCAAMPVPSIAATQLSAYLFATSYTR